MTGRLRTGVRRLKEHLFHRLHRSEEHNRRGAWRALAHVWRRARPAYLRLCRRQPAFRIVLDSPPVLTGFAAITGWAVSRSAPVRFVEAIVAGQVIASGSPREERADVAERFPHYQRRGPCGFRLAPMLGLLPEGQHPLCLRAYDARGNKTELHTTLLVQNYRLADGNDLPIHLRGSNREYQHWLNHQSRRREGAVAKFARLRSRLVADPLAGNSRFSVVMPLYRPDLGQLREAVASVQAQTHGDWELCLCDDGSQQPALTEYLQRLAAHDPRIRWTMHASNQGIAAATNTAIREGAGAYVAFLDQDDLLAPNALAEVARAVPADIIYSDWDRIDGHGCRVEPFFKPDWSPDLLRSMMYLAHLCVYRRAFLEQAGLCRSAFDGAQDWELALRATAQTERIVHLPKVLYHWRLGGHSAGTSFNRLCHERGRRALTESLQRAHVAALVEDGPTPCTFHVRYRHGDQPLVSVLIPSRDNLRLLKCCLRSIRRRTDYPHYEILIIDNGSQEPAAQRFLRSCGARVLRHDLPFNHSRLNNLAAEQARGSLVLLLNDDTEVITPHWLTAMVEQALRPEVGAVGAWLLHPDGRTQHAGVILGQGPVATPLHTGITRDGLDRGTVRVIRNVSAVTGACLMIRKSLYEELGGLDEVELPTSFNDVDLCLRLRNAGYRMVCTPLAKLYHHESASRGFRDEMRYIRIMQDRWGQELRSDPFWNPNLPHGPSPHPGFAFHWSSPPDRSTVLPAQPLGRGVQLV